MGICLKSTFRPEEDINLFLIKLRAMILPQDLVSSSMVASRVSKGVSVAPSERPGLCTRKFDTTDNATHRAV